MFLTTYFCFERFQMKRCAAQSQGKGLGPPEIEMEVIILVNAYSSMELLGAEGNPLAGYVGECFSDCHLTVSRQALA